MWLALILPESVGVLGGSLKLQDYSITYDRESLEDERRGILGWLFDFAFGRRDGTDEEAGDRIHRLGTINRYLDRDDD